jgi:hypothetical protein
VHLGHADGQQVDLDISAFHHGGYFVGRPREGKSTTMTNVLASIILSGGAGILIDDAGRSFYELEKLVANYADDIGRRLEKRAAARGCTAKDVFRVLQRKVLNRVTFAFVGTSRPNVHGIDLLKPRRMPNGEMETLERAVTGALRGFEAIYYKDIDQRATFLENLESGMTVLAAGNRPITEFRTLILDAQYWPFLMRELDRSPIANDPRNEAWLKDNRQILRTNLDLRLRKEKDGTWVERPPYSAAFRDQFGSLLRALRPFKYGSPVGHFFEADTFVPERVAYRDGVFLMMNDIANELHRSTLNLLVYAFWERLLRYRIYEEAS